MRQLLAMFSPGRLILIATIVAVAYLTVSAGGNLFHSFRLANDESRLRAEVQALQQEHEQLVRIRDYLRTDEYVEFMARRVFGLVMPGETLVVVDAPHSDDRSDESLVGQSWWERLFGE